MVTVITVITVITALPRVALTLLALAYRLPVTFREGPGPRGSTGGWGIDLSGAVMALTWWMLVIEVVLVPGAVGARLSSSTSQCTWPHSSQTPTCW
ncbi:hypothetical protein GCM10009790_30000 [Georgenia ruanii]